MKKKSADTYTKLAEELKGKNSYTTDDRLWYPATDKAGNGSAVIRFLPAPQVDGEEGTPWVRVWSHSFKNPETGLWYIENSLTTIGKPDPVGEHNTRLWNTEIEENRNKARDQKRITSYYANVLVLKDPLNPENEGQIRLFRFGPMFFDMIKAKMVPEFDDVTPINVFDFWAGATFRIRIRTEGEYRKYDRSEFDQPAPLYDDDDKLEELWKNSYSLQEFLAPKNFKTYDELKARLDLVLGNNVNTRKNVEAKIEKEPEHKKIEEPAAVAEKTLTVEEDDDDLAFFKGLMSED